ADPPAVDWAFASAGAGGAEREGRPGDPDPARSQGRGATPARRVLRGVGPRFGFVLGEGEVAGREAQRTASGHPDGDSAAGGAWGGGGGRGARGGWYRAPWCTSETSRDGCSRGTPGCGSWRGRGTPPTAGAGGTRCISAGCTGRGTRSRRGSRSARCRIWG